MKNKGLWIGLGILTVGVIIAISKKKVVATPSNNATTATPTIPSSDNAIVPIVLVADSTQAPVTTTVTPPSTPTTIPSWQSTQVLSPDNEIPPAQGSGVVTVQAFDNATKQTVNQTTYSSLTLAVSQANGNNFNLMLGDKLTYGDDNCYWVITGIFNTGDLLTENGANKTYATGPGCWATEHNLDGSIANGVNWMFYLSQLNSDTKWKLSN